MKKYKKPIIEDIIISPEKIAEFESKLNPQPRTRYASIPLSGSSRLTLIKQYFSICSICADIATKRIKYDAGDGAKVVETYCEKCYQRLTTQEPIRVDKDNKVILTASNGIDEIIAIKTEDE